MNVVYASCDNYAQFFGISVLSLFENNKDIEELNVYYLNMDLTDENVAILDGIASKYGRTITYVDVRGFLDRFGFEVDACGFNLITLSRLFLATYLPDTAHRVLYIDCDTVVDGSIAGLEDEDFEGSPVCMVPELLMHDFYKKEIGLESEDTYFNAGVMLADLDLWRAEHLDKRFIEYYNEKSGKLLYLDQDIINHVCRGRIKRLPLKYNYGTNTPFFPKWFMKKLHGEFNLSEKPVVIHYMGDERPWINGNLNILRKEFYRYRDMSPWAGMEKIKGKELYLFCYHCLNLITFVFPHFRVWFSKKYGLGIYAKRGGKT